jgi:hypothetical protein
MNRQPSDFALGCTILIFVAAIPGAIVLAALTWTLFQNIVNALPW